MRDTASHFKNHVMTALEQSRGVNRRFSVANSTWSIGMCKQMMLEVVRTLKVMIQEERRATQDWVELVRAVQWALNTAFREQYGSTPYHVIFGRAPRTALPTLASPVEQELQVGVLDDKALREKVQSVVEAQIPLDKEVLDKILANRGRQRLAASRGTLPTFIVGETFW